MRSRGLDPDAVDNVETAWVAFGEFLQTGVDGVLGPDDDGDGFIVEWGRWGWNDHRPALSFGRQLAVSDSGDRGDPYWQPDYWKVDLQVSFAPDPAWDDLERVPFHDTGFDFKEIGPLRTAALVESRSFVQSYPQLRAMWQGRPVHSCLMFEQVG